MDNFRHKKLSTPPQGSRATVPARFKEEASTLGYRRFLSRVIANQHQLDKCESSRTCAQRCAQRGCRFLPSKLVQAPRAARQYAKQRSRIMQRQCLTAQTFRRLLCFVTAMKSCSLTASTAYVLQSWQNWIRYWRKFDRGIESTHSNSLCRPIIVTDCGEPTKTSVTASRWPSMHLRTGATERLPKW